jgi:ketosteroid isomerase-like protein
MSDVQVAPNARSSPAGGEGDTLETLRFLESLRLEAMRANNAPALEALLSPDMVYVHESGRLYHRDAYLKAIETHELLYQEDVELTEEEVVVAPQAMFMFGVMRGHGMLDGEQQVFHLRYGAAWLSQGSAWKLAMVQKTPILSGVLMHEEGA